MALLTLLNQEILPVFSDEGVCRIVIDIVPQMLTKLKITLSLLGEFDLAKTIECCIGQFIKGRRIEDALTETKQYKVRS